MNALEESLQEPIEGGTTIQTTLYDLIAAIQAATEPEEEELVVGTVAYMIHSGRIKFLGNASGLN